MTAKVKKNEVNKKLVKAVTKLLDEVMAEPKKGKAAASLTDKCKVIDRFTKIEMLRLDIQDSGEGSFFNRQPEVAEDDD